VETQPPEAGPPFCREEGNSPIPHLIPISVRYDPQIPNYQHHRYKPTIFSILAETARPLELVVSVAVSAILLGGIMSTVAVTIRATDEGQGPWRGISQGRTAIDDVAGELAHAKSFTDRSAHAVEFTVADRDGDLVDETIRYAWSGTAADPLTRQYNGAAQDEVVQEVHQFDLGYAVETVAGSTVRYFVRSVDLALQAGPDTATRVETAVYVLNAPEVASP